MAMGLDDYIYCSPYQVVASLDHVVDCQSKDNRAFDIADPQPGSEILIDRQRAYDTIHRAIDVLPPRQRTVIRAIYFLGYTVTQTARLLQISATAVVKLRTRALNRLLGLLTPACHAVFV